VAVYVFFSISGYLIATSWNQSSSALGYFARRVARIFPAVIVVVLLTTFLVGPALTTLPLTDYFSSGDTWKYLSGLVLAPTYLLPGVFALNPTSAVNGSLWSLGPEFICYLIVAVIGLGTLKLTAKLSARIVIFGILAVVLALTYWMTPDKAIRDGSGAMVFFMVGAIVAHAKPKLPWWPVIPALLAWEVVGLFAPGVGMTCGWLVIPYCALALGGQSTPVVRRVGRFGDFSYGLYLWGFPVQQAVWLVAPHAPLVLDILLVLIATGALATASWYLLERRMIALGRVVSLHPDQHRSGEPVVQPALVAVPDQRRDRQAEQQGAHERTPRSE
jgi:peptidoglycan/LPS O-acetylase OafA/YrhL